MMGGWRRLALLLYTSFQTLQLGTITAARSLLLDSRSSVSLDTSQLHWTSERAPKIANFSIIPFDIDSGNETLYQVVTEIYDDPNFPGRRLKQIDQILQQKYWLVGCKAGIPNSPAAQLKSLITQIRLNLKLVIRETKKGTASEFGYEAFFKSNSTIPRVLEMFNKIANGAQVKAPISYGRSQWLKPKKGPPIIGCASTKYSEILVDDAYRMCRNPPGYAYYLDGSAWIYLCPLFWKASTCPSEQNCPKFYENGTVGHNTTILHMNQEAILVHELVHLYMPALAKRSRERYDVVDAMTLRAEEAVDNASNYGYFYSAVVAPCLTWPQNTTDIAGSPRAASMGDPGD